MSTKKTGNARMFILILALKIGVPILAIFCFFMLFVVACHEKGTDYFPLSRRDVEKYVEEKYDIEAEYLYTEEENGKKYYFFCPEDKPELVFCGYSVSIHGVIIPAFGYRGGDNYLSVKAAFEIEKLINDGTLTHTTLEKLDDDNPAKRLLRTPVVKVKEISEIKPCADEIITIFNIPDYYEYFDIILNFLPAKSKELSEFRYNRSHYKENIACKSGARDKTIYVPSNEFSYETILGDICDYCLVFNDDCGLEKEYIEENANMNYDYIVDSYHSKDGEKFAVILYFNKCRLTFGQMYEMFINTGYNVKGTPDDFTVDDNYRFSYDFNDNGRYYYIANNVKVDCKSSLPLVNRVDIFKTFGIYFDGLGETETDGESDDNSGTEPGYNPIVTI